MNFIQRPFTVVWETTRVRDLLREAHAKSMNDPELLAEAKKGKMDMDPSGEELHALTIEVMSQSQEVIEMAKKISGL